MQDVKVDMELSSDENQVAHWQFVPNEVEDILTSYHQDMEDALYWGNPDEVQDKDHDCEQNEDLAIMFAERKELDLKQKGYNIVIL